MSVRFGGWLAAIVVALIVVSLVAACSGPPAARDKSSDSPFSDEVSVSSDPVTADSNVIILNDDEGAADVSGGDGGGAGVAASGPAALVSATNDTLGEFLTDGAGRTVYLYLNDSPFDSTCDAVCQENWPPVLTLGAPEAGDAVDAGLLGTMLRDDGAEQVTYNGWPLYYSVDDAEPGTTYGQSVNGLWFVVAPTGVAVELE